MISWEINIFVSHKTKHFIHCKFAHCLGNSYIIPEKFI